MFKSMKNKTIMAAGFSLMLFLTACGTGTSVSNNTEPSPVQSEVTQTSEKGTDEEETRVITTVKGDVEVPADPKRAIVHYLIGDAVAMGIIPVGVSEVNSGAAFEESIKGAVDLGSWDFELESVMALEPDLIITVNEEQYEELSKIAPTVFVPYGTMTTEERVTFMGEVFNRQEEAKKTLSDYEDKVESGKTRLQEAGLESAAITILQAREDGSSVAGSKHALGVLTYNELGMIPPEMVQKEIIDKDEYWAQPSLEVLSEYCGDYLIHLGDIPEAINSNNVWKSIPAVKNENIIIADTALTYYTDIISSGVLIDTLVDDLIELWEAGR